MIWRAKKNCSPLFAGPSQTMEGLRVQGDALVADNDRLRNFLATTSGRNVESLVPADYDAFVVVGMGVDIRPLAARTYSEAVLSATCRGLITSSLAWTMIERLRQLTDAPIHCIAAPIKALTPDRFEETYPFPVLSYADLAHRSAAVLDERAVRLVLQPDSTRAHDWRTRAELARGSTRLIQGTAHPEGDNTHMNATYGADMIRALLAQF
jgi:hypothetical protein